MNAGDLRTRALLQRRLEADTDSGGKVGTYATVGTIWCQDVSSVGKSGHLLREQQQIRTTLSHAIRVRFTNTIAPTMRLIIGDAVLTIVNVTDPESTRDGLVLLCEQVVPNG